MHAGTPRAVIAARQAYLQADKTTVTLHLHEDLLRNEDSSNDIHVVVEGVVEVYECESGIALAQLQPGQCLSSLLRLVNYLTGTSSSAPRRVRDVAQAGAAARGAGWWALARRRRARWCCGCRARRSSGPSTTIRRR